MFEAVKVKGKAVHVSVQIHEQVNVLLRALVVRSPIYSSVKDPCRDLDGTGVFGVHVEALEVREQRLVD